MTILMNRTIEHHFGNSHVSIKADSYLTGDLEGDGTKTTIAFDMTDNVSPVEVHSQPNGFVIEITGSWERDAFFKSIKALATMCDPLIADKT